jgi:site-specific DNA-adenine methylase
MISTTILLSTLKDDFNYTTTLHPKGRFQLHYCSPPQRTISTTLLLSTLKDDFNYTTALHPRGRFQLHYCSPPQRTISTTPQYRQYNSSLIRLQKSVQLVKIATYRRDCEAPTGLHIYMQKAAFSFQKVKSGERF